MKLFDTVLVANRGEIAVRVIRTLRTLGIRSVAVYSDADAGALHVRLADVAVRLGPGPAAHSYLNIDAILAACQKTGAQAVHPGYGFLSENVDFARALEAAGIVFVGPPVPAINLMGDKIRAKNHLAGRVPVTPGLSEPGYSDAQLISGAAELGFPLLIKPSAGGGGKGMVAVDSAQQLPAALASARRTARAAFGDDTLLLERLVSSPRHLEVQVLADTHGHTVHLGERECSLQRRHQKVIEEAPSPLLENLPHGRALRARLGAAAVAVAQSVGYVGAGTVEFLLSDHSPDEFFFMEMNTRLQVEHPVTEQVVRVDGQPLDLVAWQLRIAAGQALDFDQSQVSLRGHAVEARLYAEDPAAGFLPSTGTLQRVIEPTGPQLRVDSSMVEGLSISAHYDPMLAKIIAWGEDRTTALATLDAALADTVVLGVHTNAEYLRQLLALPEVIAGRLDTTLIERTLPQLSFRQLDPRELALAAYLTRPTVSGSASVWDRRDGWRLSGSQASRIQLQVHGPGDSKPIEAMLTEEPASTLITLGEKNFRVSSQPDARVMIDGVGTELHHALTPDGTCWVGQDGFSAAVHRVDREQQLARQLAALDQRSGTVSPHVHSPMPGTVIALHVRDGQRVNAGELVLSVEAMKMEHQLLAPRSGIVTLGAVRVGSLVKAEQVLASIRPESDDEPVQEELHG